MQPLRPAPEGGSRPHPEPGRECQARASPGPQSRLRLLSPPAGAARTPLAPLSASANPRGNSEAWVQTPSAAGTCPRTGVMSGHPPSGRGQCESSLLSLANTPTPNPAALRRCEAAPGSYRSQRRAQRQPSGQRSCRQRQDAVCVCGWEDRGPQTLPVHRQASQPQRPAGRGPRKWPAPTTTRPGRPTGTKPPTQDPSAALQPHSLARGRRSCPAGPCPSPWIPSGKPGARPKKLG